MMPYTALLNQLDGGGLDDTLRQLHCVPQSQIPEQARARVREVLQGFETTFHPASDVEVALCSAPGRTEICGNHTDHQQGRVLAASINLDMLACVAPNGTSQVRFHSKGWPSIQLDLTQLSPQPEERETTQSILRGMAARIKQLGYAPQGFDAYVISDVLPGSGLSSSAACEVLVGVILNHLFCEDALSPVTIAQIGQYAENVFFEKPSGLMDQMASSVGGAVFIDFKQQETPVIEQVSVDLADLGYALCILDSGAHHADLTGEYAAIPQEMRAVAALFGKEVLRQVEPEEFFRQMGMVRAKVGDRAALRALHFFEDDARVTQEVQALQTGDMPRFLGLVNASGRSSWMYLQNIDPAGSVAHQPMAFALGVMEHALQGRGAYRVHGGGFAGTLQAFVPLDMLEGFRQTAEGALGAGTCHVLSIRPVGGFVLTP